MPASASAEGRSPGIPTADAQSLAAITAALDQQAQSHKRAQLELAGRSIDMLLELHGSDAVDEKTGAAKLHVLWVPDTTQHYRRNKTRYVWSSLVTWPGSPLYCIAQAPGADADSGGSGSAAAAAAAALAGQKPAENKLLDVLEHHNRTRPRMRYLVNLLQTCVRQCDAIGALQTCNAMLESAPWHSKRYGALRVGWTVLLERIIVMMIEDAILHPDAGVLLWLLIAARYRFASWKPRATHIAFVRRVVLELALMDERESDVRVDTAAGDMMIITHEPIRRRELEELRRARTDDEVMAILCLSARAEMGGPKSESDLLLRFARLWFARFKWSMPGKSSMSSRGTHLNSIAALREHWRQHTAARMADVMSTQSLRRARSFEPSTWVVSAMNYSVTGDLIGMLWTEVPQLRSFLLDTSKNIADEERRAEDRLRAELKAEVKRNRRGSGAIGRPSTAAIADASAAFPGLDSGLKTKLAKPKSLATRRAGRPKKSAKQTTGADATSASALVGVTEHDDVGSDGSDGAAIATAVAGNGVAGARSVVSPSAVGAAELAGANKLIGTIIWFLRTRCSRKNAFPQTWPVTQPIIPREPVWLVNSALRSRIQERMHAICAHLIHEQNLGIFPGLPQYAEELNGTIAKRALEFAKSFVGRLPGATGENGKDSKDEHKGERKGESKGGGKGEDKEQAGGATFSVRDWCPARIDGRLHLANICQMALSRQVAVTVTVEADEDATAAAATAAATAAAAAAASAAATAVADDDEGGVGAVAGAGGETAADAADTKTKATASKTYKCRYDVFQDPHSGHFIISLKRKGTAHIYSTLSFETLVRIEQDIVSDDWKPSEEWLAECSEDIEVAQQRKEFQDLLQKQGLKERYSTKGAILVKKKRKTQSAGKRARKDATEDADDVKDADADEPDEDAENDGGDSDAPEAKRTVPAVDADGDVSMTTAAAAPKAKRKTAHQALGAVGTQIVRSRSIVIGQRFYPRWHITHSLNPSEQQQMRRNMLTLDMFAPAAASTPEDVGLSSRLFLNHRTWKTDLLRVMRHYFAAQVEFSFLADNALLYKCAWFPSAGYTLSATSPSADGGGTGVRAVQIRYTHDKGGTWTLQCNATGQRLDFTAAHFPDAASAQEFLGIERPYPVVMPPARAATDYPVATNWLNAPGNADYAAAILELSAGSAGERKQHVQPMRETLKLFDETRVEPALTLPSLGARTPSGRTLSLGGVGTTGGAGAGAGGAGVGGGGGGAASSLRVIPSSGVFHPPTQRFSVSSDSHCRHLANAIATAAGGRRSVLRQWILALQLLVYHNVSWPVVTQLPLTFTPVPLPFADTPADLGRHKLILSLLVASDVVAVIQDKSAARLLHVQLHASALASTVVTLCGHLCAEAAAASTTTAHAAAPAAAATPLADIWCPVAFLEQRIWRPLFEARCDAGPHGLQMLASSCQVLHGMLMDVVDGYRTGIRFERPPRFDPMMRSASAIAATVTGAGGAGGSGGAAVVQYGAPAAPGAFDHDARILALGMFAAGDIMCPVPGRTALYEWKMAPGVPYQCMRQLADLVRVWLQQCQRGDRQWLFEMRQQRGTGSAGNAWSSGAATGSQPAAPLTADGRRLAFTPKIIRPTGSTGHASTLVFPPLVKDLSSRIPERKRTPTPVDIKQQQPQQQQQQQQTRASPVTVLPAGTQAPAATATTTTTTTVSVLDKYGLFDAARIARNTYRLPMFSGRVAVPVDRLDIASEPFDLARVFERAKELRAADLYERDAVLAALLEMERRTTASSATTTPPIWLYETIVALRVLRATSVAAAAVAAVPATASSSSSSSSSSSASATTAATVASGAPASRTTPASASNVVTELLPWQVDGLWWLLRAEQRQRAAILADEFGLGKTLQVIALIAANRPIEASAAPAAPAAPMAATMKPTLVVCRPGQISIPWVADAMRTEWAARALSVYVHHPTRAERYNPPSRDRPQPQPSAMFTPQTMQPCEKLTNLQEIERFAVVIVSYRTLELEHKQGGSVLHRIKWDRIVLDEAATSARLSDAIMEGAIATLDGACRIVLMHMAPQALQRQHMFSLLHFLRVQPFCSRDWFAQYDRNRKLEYVHRLCLRRHRDCLVAVSATELQHTLRMSAVENLLYQYASLSATSGGAAATASAAAASEIDDIARDETGRLLRQCMTPLVYWFWKVDADSDFVTNMARRWYARMHTDGKLMSAAIHAAVGEEERDVVLSAAEQYALFAADKTLSSSVPLVAQRLFVEYPTEWMTFLDLFGQALDITGNPDALASVRAAIQQAPRLFNTARFAYVQAVVKQLLPDKSPLERARPLLQQDLRVRRMSATARDLVWNSLQHMYDYGYATTRAATIAREAAALASPLPPVVGEGSRGTATSITTDGGGDSADAAASSSSASLMSTSTTSMMTTLSLLLRKLGDTTARAEISTTDWEALDELIQAGFVAIDPRSVTEWLETKQKLDATVKQSDKAVAALDNCCRAWKDGSCMALSYYVMLVYDAARRAARPYGSEIIDMSRPVGIVQIKQETTAMDDQYRYFQQQQRQQQLARTWVSGGTGSNGHGGGNGSGSGSGSGNGSITPRFAPLPQQSSAMGGGGAGLTFQLPRRGGASASSAAAAATAVRPGGIAISAKELAASTLAVHTSMVCFSFVWKPTALLTDLYRKLIKSVVSRDLWAGEKIVVFCTYASTARLVQDVLERTLGNAHRCVVRDEYGGRGTCTASDIALLRNHPGASSDRLPWSDFSFDGDEQEEGEEEEVMHERKSDGGAAPDDESGSSGDGGGGGTTIAATRTWTVSGEIGRSMATAMFRFVPECRVLIATYGACPSDVSVTEARNVLHIEPVVDPTVINKANKMVLRAGQSRPVYVYRPISTSKTVKSTTVDNGAVVPTVEHAMLERVAAAISSGSDAKTSATAACDIVDDNARLQHTPAEPVAATPGEGKGDAEDGEEETAEAKGTTGEAGGGEEAEVGSAATAAAPGKKEKRVLGKRKRDTNDAEDADGDGTDTSTADVGAVSGAGSGAGSAAPSAAIATGQQKGRKRARTVH